MPTTSYAGLDYGHKKSNFDPKTGIRFGIISQNSGVLQAWADSSEAVFIYHCPYCGQLLKKGIDAKRCPSCHKKIKEGAFDSLDPVSYSYEEEGYFCECGEDGDIWITKSPYFTYAQFCSPCAPGACHLNNPLEEPVQDNKCYCLGHDWFESGKATYPVYSIETGEQIKL
jgi:ribosomal protein L37AE/L43A